MNSIKSNDEFIRLTIKPQDRSGKQWLNYLKNKHFNIVTKKTSSNNNGVFEFVLNNDNNFNSPFRGDTEIIIIKPMNKQKVEKLLNVKLEKPYFEIACLIADNFEKLNFGNFKQVVIPRIGKLCYDPQGYWLTTICLKKIEDQYFYSGLDLSEQLPCNTGIAYTISK
ncbi:MAG: hypothetical protein WAV23_02050 [Minisyncoccia bacterium]